MGRASLRSVPEWLLLRSVYGHASWHAASRYLPPLTPFVLAARNLPYASCHPMSQPLFVKKSSDWCCRNTMTSNPALKRSNNGRPPGPGWQYGGLPRSFGAPGVVGPFACSWSDGFRASSSATGVSLMGQLALCTNGGWPAPRFMNLGSRKAGARHRLLTLHRRPRQARLICIRSDVCFRAAIPGVRRTALGRKPAPPIPFPP